jgi:hypothetical protein
MPQFEIDLGCDFDRWKALDSFTQGYVEALYFTECNSDNVELEMMTFADMADDTLAMIVAECASFQTENVVELEHVYSLERYTDKSAGADFWLTRNRHGAGFWDRGLGAWGDKLTKAAHSYGGRDAYAGDDGKLYLG